MAELPTIDAAELIDQAERWTVEGEPSDALLDVLAALLVEAADADADNQATTGNATTAPPMQHGARKSEDYL